MSNDGDGGGSVPDVSPDSDGYGGASLIRSAS
jgi:hypothetical protein